MDEILIEEKKYVSSKRAAKITGYAKDYIGQLCREGRVPARLVGRSWYVLESAIQDHRFGKPVKNDEEPESSEEREIWEATKYEAAPVETLPVINDPEEVVVPSDVSPVEDEKPLEANWRSWFDQVTPPQSNQEEPKQETEEAPRAPVAEEEAPQIALGEGDSEVQVPIRTVYELPPEDLLPRFERKTVPKDPVQSEKSEQVRVVKDLSISPALKLVAVLIAVFTGAMAIISTGYFDNMIGSFNQASVFTGIKVYSK